MSADALDVVSVVMFEAVSGPAFSFPSFSFCMANNCAFILACMSFTRAAAVLFGCTFGMATVGFFSIVGFIFLARALAKFTCPCPFSCPQPCAPPMTGLTNPPFLLRFFNIFVILHFIKMARAFLFVLWAGTVGHEKNW